MPQPQPRPREVRLPGGNYVVVTMESGNVYSYHRRGERLFRFTYPRPPIPAEDRAARRAVWAGNPYWGDKDR